MPSPLLYNSKMIVPFKSKINFTGKMMVLFKRKINFKKKIIVTLKSKKSMDKILCWSRQHRNESATRSGKQVVTPRSG